MSVDQQRPNYDQTLKRLLGQAHDGVLALLLPGARWLGESSPELAPNVRQADLVWEVALADQERVLLHIELQTNPDSAIGERLAEYAIRLWRHAHLPVRSVVVYLRRGGQVAESPFVFGRGGGEEGLRYRYDVVRLWQEPPERVLSAPEAWLWPLAALMGSAPAETTALVAERIARSTLPSADRKELTSLLAILAGMRLPRPVVDRLIRRNPMLRDLLENNSFVDLMRDEGREKGRQEGLQEGRQEGKAEGKREMAQSILESRFGPLQADELAALQGADESMLHALPAHVATDSREELRTWLGLAPVARNGV